MSDPRPVDVRLAGQTLVGVQPLLPVVFLLDGARRAALGFEAGHREPLHPPDGYALQCAYAAALGACHPAPQWPALRQCRHDVVAYGAGVIDWYLRAHGAAGLRELYDEGKRILGELTTSATSALEEEIEEERSFTTGPAEGST